MKVSGNEAAMLDALGEVTEQIKELEAKKKELRAALGTMFESRTGGAYTTDSYNVAFTTSPGRKSLDTAALREAVPDLDQYYKVGKPFMTLKITRLD